MPIVQDYISYTEKWKKEYGENTVVLMQVGSFFEIYGLRDSQGNISGSNIEDVATKCDLLIAKKGQKIKNKQVVMAGFGLTQIDKYIKKLQELGYTCPIYTQDTQTKNTNRSLSEIVSPGTYFSADSEIISNNAACVWIKKVNKTRYTPEQVQMGVAAIDVNSGKSTISQFTSQYYNDPTTYDDIERQLAIIAPHEIIIVFRGLQNDECRSIVSYIGVSNKKVHIVQETDSSEIAQASKNAEKQRYQGEIMKTFFPEISLEVIHESFRTHELSMQAYTMLIDFIYAHNTTILNKISFATLENYADTLLLANHSLRQLNILCDDRHNGKLRSVTSLLDNCCTSMGNRSFRYSFTRPTTNIKKLEDNYNDIQNAIVSETWEKVRLKLKGVRDIDQFYRKLTANKVTPRDIARLNDDLIKIVELFLVVEKCKPLLESIKSRHIDCISNVRFLINLFDSNFDMEKCYDIDDVSEEKLGLLTPEKACFVKSGAVVNEIQKAYSASLDCDSALGYIQTYFCELVAEYEKKNTGSYVKIHETPKSSPILCGTNRRMKILKSALDDTTVKSQFNIKINGEETPFDVTQCEIKQYSSSKKDLMITSPQIQIVCDGLQSSRQKLIHELDKFFWDFCNKLAEKKDIFENISKFVAWVDCLQNACYMAVNFNYTRPKINASSEKAFLNCIGLRHPLIERLQVNETYVPNDLTLGDEIDGLLLYGTNAVGKSSFIKSLGIAVIMAQAGLYVPCVSMVFKPYSKIFTRILGNDNIFKGLSTFAVEMSELRTILNQSDKNSLVIGDELCSGTESNSAKSIFTAGVEWLHNANSSFIFATHFHEICNYEEIEKLNRLKLMHMSVIYDKETDALVYDRLLKDGAGEDMYGLEVCKSLSLKPEFLERAHNLRIKYNPKDQNILSAKTSHFNAKKVVTNCELCGKIAEEVHHLQHQQKADDNGYINGIHKNHPANLMNLCKGCHDNIHETGQQHRRVKTSKGYKLVSTKS